MLKTFYGLRKTFELDFCINDKISELITKISIEEDLIYKDSKEIAKWNFADQYKLYTTKRGIKEINPLKTFKEELIENREIIILLPLSLIYFSEILKGPMIYLENKNKIAMKQGSDDHQILFCDKGFSIGKNYVEFVLLTEPYEKSVIIGLSLKRPDFYFNPAESKNFWGFVLSDCKKISCNASNKTELIEYGDISKISDRVGILTEFTKNGLDVSFFINKINMGVAFKSLPLNTYYPIVILGYDGARVKVVSNVQFPDV